MPKLSVARSPAAAVLARRGAWAYEVGDCLRLTAALPDDSIDLIVTSPPYPWARTYSIGFKMDVETWTRWMVSFVRIAARKCRGLIAINCDGHTRGHRYHPAPYLLMADLHRAGFTLRRPVVFHRVGIPGSGGRDWFRADTEPVVCVARPGRLPWSDNTACGHPPKWAPGGAMSHRMTGGERVNQWGGRMNTRSSGSQRRAHGGRQDGGRPSHQLATRRATRGSRNGDTHAEDSYTPPAMANPGNLRQQLYTADEVAALLADAGDVLHTVVGGGCMGHPAAHQNEAPFPTVLPELFVRSFCRPGGVVLDPFCGSGTTIQSALEHGRRAIGFDRRPSQRAVAAGRMRTVIPVGV